MRIGYAHGDPQRECAQVMCAGSVSAAAGPASGTRLLIPDIAAEIVYGCSIETPAQTFEVRGGSVHLCAVRGVDRCLVPLDLAVIDVHVGGTRGYADAARADVTV